MLSSSIIALTRACRQVVYFDLIKRLPRDQKNQLDFHSQDFDLMLSVISTEARTGARRKRGVTVDAMRAQGFEEAFKAALQRAVLGIQIIAQPGRTSMLRTIQPCSVVKAR